MEKELEKKLREICDKIKERHPTRAVCVELLCWDYSNGSKATKYEVWIEDIRGRTTFGCLDDLVAFEKCLPIRNPILYRKFNLKEG